MQQNEKQKRIRNVIEIVIIAVLCALTVVLDFLPIPYLKDEKEGQSKNFVFLESGKDYVTQTKNIQNNTSNTMFFTLNYGEKYSQIPFDVSRNDCYIIVLTEKDKQSLYYWKQCLYMLFPKEIKVFVLLFVCKN